MLRLRFGGGMTVDGGAGYDTVSGLAGARLAGGSGADLWLMGDAPAQASKLVQILDWSSQDHFQVDGIFISHLNDPERSAPDFATALSQLNGSIPVHGVIAYQIGADVVVFSNPSNSSPADIHAVMLTGRSLADIDAANIVSDNNF